MPFRAIGDLRLQGADLRVLGAIAAHDGLGKNGRGCDAGRVRIAFLCGLNLATFSKSIRRLQEFDYITVEAHPTDGRRRIWRVIYTAEDGELISSRTNPTNQEWVACGQPNSGQIGGAEATETTKIGCLRNMQPTDFNEQPKHNIFPERENKFREPANRFAECAHRPRSIKSRICEIERKWLSAEIGDEDASERLSVLMDLAEDAEETNHIERIWAEIAVEAAS